MATSNTDWRASVHSHRTPVVQLALLAIGSLSPAAFAQPVPLPQRVGGVLVGELTLDAIYLTRDINADGDALDPGEVTLYFDGSNASGLPSPTTSVFNIFPSVTGVVFFTDGGTDAVYRLIDLNGDGDALDKDEANVWFSAAGNFHGFDLPTPNGIHQSADGALYIVNAGTGSSPSDAVYRTVDLNGDGDAQDEDEATLWFDMQTLAKPSSAFDVAIIDDTLFIADTRGGSADAIVRARDENGDGMIDASEFNTFIDDDNPYGVQLATALVTDGVSLYASEGVSSFVQTVYRLTDLDGSGAIDDPAEAELVWDENHVPNGYELASSFGMAIGAEGELVIGSAGADPADNIFRLVDLNGDGDFLDADETIVWSDAGGGPGLFVDNPRALAYAVSDCNPCDVNCDGAVDAFDIEPFVNLIFGPPACSICAGDTNGDGLIDAFDIEPFIACLVGP